MTHKIAKSVLEKRLAIEKEFGMPIEKLLDELHNVKKINFNEIVKIIDSRVEMKISPSYIRKEFERFNIKRWQISREERGRRTMTKLWKDENFIKTQRELQERRKTDEEYKRKMIEANKKTHNSPEMLMAKRIRGKEQWERKSPEEKKAVAENSKKIWKDPDFKKRFIQRIKELHKEGHYKESYKAVSKSSKERWSDPEFVEKVMEKHAEYFRANPSEDEILCKEILEELKLWFIPQYKGLIKKYKLVPDFLIKKEKEGKKFFIEVQGDFWHANPSIYENKQLNKTQIKNIKKDFKKLQVYNSLGIPCLFIFGEELKDKDKAKAKILTFLKEEKTMGHEYLFEYYSELYEVDENEKVYENGKV